MYENSGCSISSSVFYVSLLNFGLICLSLVTSYGGHYFRYLLAFHIIFCEVSCSCDLFAHFYWVLLLLFLTCWRVTGRVLLAYLTSPVPSVPPSAERPRNTLLCSAFGEAASHLGKALFISGEIHPSCALSLPLACTPEHLVTTVGVI